MKFAYAAAALSLTTAASAASIGSAMGFDTTYDQTQNNIMVKADSGVYYGQTVGAAAIDDSYLTYVLVSDDADSTALTKCENACTSTTNCAFFNIYQELLQGSNVPKQMAPYQTCALFSQCLQDSSFTNYGGQGPVPGPYNSITNSNGYCNDCAWQQTMDALGLGQLSRRFSRMFRQ